jgi:hypothetical protein
LSRLVFVLALMFIGSSLVSAQTQYFSFEPIVNEVSLFQNFLDDGNDAGQTLQIVSINSMTILTDFSVEFTADFNRKMTPGHDTDYYLEIGIVKPVLDKISLNYQRVHGTFVDKPVNQIGIRYSF